MGQLIVPHTRRMRSTLSIGVEVELGFLGEPAGHALIDGLSARAPGRPSEQHRRLNPEAACTPPPVRQINVKANLVRSSFLRTCSSQVSGVKPSAGRSMSNAVY